MDFKKLVKQYLTIRDGKADLEAAHKKKKARFDNAMKKIEEMFLVEFNETGQESAKTEFGTAYKATRVSTKVADRDAFLNFVRENEAWEFLESRANKTAVTAFMDEHKDLPPGVDVNTAVTINIRRS